MKTYELIKFIESNVIAPVFTHEAQKIGFGNVQKTLISVLRHKNQTLYREKRENIDSMVHQQIDRSQHYKDKESLQMWQAVQSKLMKLVEEELV